MRRSVFLVVLVPLLAFLASSCGNLKSGNVTGPSGGDGNTPIILGIPASVPVNIPFAPGDSVFIGGSFAKTTPLDFEDWDFYGTVAQDGTIVGSYNRLVFAAGEVWTVRLAVKHDGDYLPVYDGISANGVPLTAFVYNSWQVFRAFKVGRSDSGEVFIDPIRDDNFQRVDNSLWTNGTFSEDPDSLDLNIPMSPDVPIKALDAWSFFKLVKLTYDPQGLSYAGQTSFLTDFQTPKTYYVRFELPTGQPIIGGCHVGNHELKYLVNGAAPGAGTWLLFAFELLPDGTFRDLGPDNRAAMVGIGHQ